MVALFPSAWRGAQAHHPASLRATHRHLIRRGDSCRLASGVLVSPPGGEIRTGVASEAGTNHVINPKFLKQEVHVPSCVSPCRWLLLGSKCVHLHYIAIVPAE